MRDGRAASCGRAAAGAALALASLLAAGPPVRADAPSGDARRGERVFQYCFSCHSVASGETARLQGPSLYRILGRPAASVPGFAYSDALREGARGGLRWDAATLERYLADPESVVPGTAMSIPPLRDAGERADLIAYLAASGRYVP